MTRYADGHEAKLGDTVEIIDPQFPSPLYGKGARVEITRVCADGGVCFFCKEHNYTNRDGETKIRYEDPFYYNCAYRFILIARADGSKPELPQYKGRTSKKIYE